MVRENLVREIAKMIDPGAFSVWYQGTGKDAKPVEPSARKRYAQSRADCLAIDLLKRLQTESSDSIREALIEFEIEGWREIGAPMDDPSLRSIIRNKYAQSTGRATGE